VQVQLPWLEDRPDAYRALCRLWASEEFQAKSMKKRNSANKGGKHTFGGDGYIRTAKRMVRLEKIFFINISTVICY
jgi:hypothetical protein